MQRGDEPSTIRGLERVAGLHEELRPADEEGCLQVVPLFLDPIGEVQVGPYPVGDPGGARQYRQEGGDRLLGGEPPVGLQVEEAVAAQVTETDSGCVQIECVRDSHEDPLFLKARKLHLEL